MQDILYLTIKDTGLQYIKLLTSMLTTSPSLALCQKSDLPQYSSQWLCSFPPLVTYRHIVDKFHKERESGRQMKMKMREGMEDKLAR